MTKVYITRHDGEHDVEIEVPCDLPEELVTVDDDVLRAWRNHCAQHRLWNTYWSAAKDFRLKHDSGPITAFDAWQEYLRSFAVHAQDPASAQLCILFDEKTP